MNQNLIVLNHYVELDQWKSVTIGGVPTRQAIVMGHNGPVLAIRDPQYGFIADIELMVDEE